MFWRPVPSATELLKAAPVVGHGEDPRRRPSVERRLVQDHDTY